MVTNICKTCGEEFVTSKDYKHYCSDECKAQNPRYKNLLKHKERRRNGGLDEKYIKHKIKVLKQLGIKLSESEIDHLHESKTISDLDHYAHDLIMKGD